MKTMRLGPSQRLVLHALRFHGPLEDSQLAWWMGHFGMSKGSAKGARYRLAKRGLVAALGRARRNEGGQLVNRWEALFGKRPPRPDWN